MESRFVYNPLDKEVKVQVHGSWFIFKPKQIKQLNEDKVEHINTNCRYLGLVPLDNKFEDPEHKLTDEGKKTLESAAISGKRDRYAYCQRIFHNQTISLKKELEGSGVDYRSYLNPELEALFEEMAQYKKSTDIKTSEKTISRMSELEKMLK